MVSATSSRGRNASPALHDLREAIILATRSQPVPLLVVRLPELERIAWRGGKAAARRLERAAARVFGQVARRVLRAGDCTAHEAGTEVFLIAMSARARESSGPSAVDCRAVLERTAAAMSVALDVRPETGWTVVRRIAASGLASEIGVALERGARERERYEFFATVGHELRTPLTAIRGYLETLLDTEVDPETARRFAQTAQREALRLGRLIDGMFEFSLLDLSSATLAKRSCGLAAQLNAACEVVRPLADARGIEVLTDASAGLTVPIEPDACLQLFVNLLSNAIHYGRNDGAVRVSARRLRKHTLIAVDDDGPGIARAERESVFSLRTRGASARDTRGSGIGLAIVRMIVEHAGGTVRVGTSPLGGAGFEILLP